MPAPPLTNNYEGGVSGNAIATTDTGSGDAWSAVTKAVGATINYQSAQKHGGALSAEIVQSTTAGSTFVAWTGLGSLTVSVYQRVYVYMPSLPAGVTVMIPMAYRAAADAANVYLRINAAGTISAVDLGQNTINTGVKVVPLNEWFRLEWRVKPSATVGEVEWKLFSSVSPGDGADGTTPTETINSAATQVLAANIDSARFGRCSGIDTVVSRTDYFDDCACSATDWLGPSGGGAPFVPGPPSLVRSWDQPPILPASPLWQGR